MAAKKIIDLVRDKKAAMTTGADKATVAEKNQRLAVAAIIGGIKSPAWQTYMEQFVDQSDPNQLKRLLATDSTAGNPKFDLRRAYLVSGGTCGETTGGFFGNEVDTIDDAP